MIVLHPVTFLEGNWDARVRSGGSQSSEKNEDRSSPINNLNQNPVNVWILEIQRHVVPTCSWHHYTTDSNETAHWKSTVTTKHLNHTGKVSSHWQSPSDSLWLHTDKDRVTSREAMDTPKTRLDGEQSSVKLHLTGKVCLTLRLYPIHSQVLEGTPEILELVDLSSPQRKLR